MFVEFRRQARSDRYSARPVARATGGRGGPRDCRSLGPAGCLSSGAQPRPAADRCSGGPASATPAREAGAELGAVAPLGLALRVLAHELHFLGLAPGFGVLAFRWLVTPQTREAPRGASWPLEVDARLWRLVN